jgi:catechol 2,3-dioxygenase-like lactoylglutathione lyase family enzyme
MADQRKAPSPTRVVPYANTTDVDASRAFYTDVLGFDVAMEEPVLGLASAANPSAQVLVPRVGFDEPQPHFGVDVGGPEAVDAAHTAAVQRGLRVVYALRDEPWGVRRFFVEDPNGTIVNVLAHTAA